MLIQASQLIGLPVGSLQEQAKIGQVREVIIDPDNGELLGFVVKKAGIFGSQKVLATIDIIEFDKNGLVTKSGDNLLDPAEIIKIKKVLDKQQNIIGLKAETESKKTLGRVYDLVIDTASLMVTKYYLKKILEERIIPADKVIKIEKEKIIFMDDSLEETMAVEPEGAAA